MKQILKSHTILYAEDNKAVRASTTEYLERYFKAVYVAHNGKEALALYDSTEPDALMLDIDMPYIDGLSVAKEVRKHNEAIPILMLTAFTDTQMLLEATELNLCKYLVKPMEPKAFKEALGQLAQKLQKLHHPCIVLPQGYKWQSKQAILYKEDVPIALLPKEQALLSLLMKHQHDCVCFEDIMAVVWADDFEAEISIDAVKYQVSQLRKKLPKGIIQNVYGKGYKLG